jgi:prevent-host-death family protein
MIVMASESIESLPASQARARLSELLNLVSTRGDRIILERHGKPVAALISIEDLEMFQYLEDQAEIALANEALAEGGEPIPLEDVERRLGLL